MTSATLFVMTKRQWRGVLYIALAYALYLAAVWLISAR